MAWIDPSTASFAAELEREARELGLPVDDAPAPQGGLKDLLGSVLASALLGADRKPVDVTTASPATYLANMLRNTQTGQDVAQRADRDFLGQMQADSDREEWISQGAPEQYGPALPRDYSAYPNPIPAKGLDGVNIFGKTLGAYGLDASGVRENTTWKEALGNTVAQLDPRNFAYEVGQAWEGLPRQTAYALANPESEAAIEPATGSSLMLAGTAAITGGVVPKSGMSLGTFGGRLAKTADQAALAKAEEMAAKGAPKDAIWNETGWFQGVDGKWRFEIDDSGAENIRRQTDAARTAKSWAEGDVYFDASLIANRAKKRGISLEDAKRSWEEEKGAPVSSSSLDLARSHSPEKLSNLSNEINERALKAKPGDRPYRVGEAIKHDDLYAAYPGLDKRPYTMRGIDQGFGTRGSYSPKDDSFTTSRFNDDLTERSTFLHESQHAIQERENFARGYNPHEAGADVAHARYAQEELREKIERMQNQHRDEARVIMARAENGDPESIAYVKKAKEKIFDRLGRQSNENPFGATDLDAVAFTVTEDDAVFKSIARDYNKQLKLSRKDPHDVYKSHAGEVEARNVQTRRDMTPEERRAKPPWTTQDVPDEDQIVRFGSGKAESTPILRSGKKAPPTETGWTFRGYRDINRVLEKGDNRKINGEVAGFGDIPVVEVPINRLWATQKTVNDDFATTESSSGMLPLIVRKNGEMYVRDGHHRITKVAEDGSQTVRAKFVDLDRADTSTPLLDYPKIKDELAKRGADDDEILRALFSGEEPDLYERIKKGELFSNPKESAVAGSAMREAAKQVDNMGYYSQALESAKSVQNKGTPEQTWRQLSEAPNVRDNELIATRVHEYILGKEGAQAFERFSKLRAQVDKARKKVAESMPKLERKSGESNKDWSDRKKQRAAEIDERVGQPVADMQAAKADVDAAAKYGNGKKSITKQEVIDHLEKNRVELRESVYPERLKRYPIKYEVIEDEPHLTNVMVDDGHDITEAQIVQKPGQIVVNGLDGGAKYFNHPNTPDGRAQGMVQAKAWIERHKQLERYEEKETKYDRYSLSKDKDDPTYRETVVKLPEDKDDFLQAHFPDDVNAVAHYRSQHLKTDKGETSLNLDELQSDWGQKLREGGVRDEAKIADLEKRLRDNNDEILQKMDAITIAAETDGFDLKAANAADANPFYLEEYLRSNSGSSSLATMIRDEIIDIKEKNRLLKAEINTAKAATPGNPLVNTTDQWTATALRKVVKDAVDQGVDGITITPGKVNADRYNQTLKDVIGLGYDPDRGTLYYRDAKSRTADGYPEHGWRSVASGVTKEKLSDYVGKEAAKRLIQSPKAKLMQAGQPLSGSYHRIDFDNGMELGGEGMKYAYDQMYPRQLAKVLKKLDPSIKPEKRYIPEHDLTVDYFPLTEKAKAKIKEGQPLFSNPASAALPAAGMSNAAPKETLKKIEKDFNEVKSMSHDEFNVWLQDTAKKLGLPTHEVKSLLERAAAKAPQSYLEQVK